MGRFYQACQPDVRVIYRDERLSLQSWIDFQLNGRHIQRSLGFQDSKMHTFLYTDIADSSRFWQRLPEDMSQALATHDGIIKRDIPQNHSKNIHEPKPRYGCHAGKIIPSYNPHQDEA
jgi:hypothetical protein